MSPEANRVLTYMVKNLVSCSYIYRSIAEGCYLTAVENNGMERPAESMDEVITEFFSIMESLNE